MKKKSLNNFKIVELNSIYEIKGGQTNICGTTPNDTESGSSKDTMKSDDCDYESDGCKSCADDPAIANPFDRNSRIITDALLVNNVSFEEVSLFYN